MSQTQTEDIVANLAELGLPVEAIRLAIPSLPERQIKHILSVRRSVQSPEQAALADEVRGLMRVAVRKATTIIEFGPPEHRIQLIRALLSNAGRLVAQEEDTTTTELRAELTELFSEIRDVPPNPDVITEASFQDISNDRDDEPHAAEIAPPVPPAYDQDDEYGVQKTGFELR